MKLLLLLATTRVFLGVAALAADGRIMLPADKSAVPSGDVMVIATAPGGKLELDGQPVAAEQPFPTVLQAQLKVSPGEHKLALVSAGGRQEIRFYSGPQPPSGFLP